MIKGHLKVKHFKIGLENVLRFNVSLLQSQKFLFHMYKNINTDLVVKYFSVCVIFRIISRTNRGQIIEKWAFSEYK